ncbi:hypothetical protein MMC07_009611 [Pseudocyphellaria aurata]|nr:hypothetical protein [Pseudocyphellaria aurata]
MTTQSWMVAEQLGNEIFPTVDQLLAFLVSQMDKRGPCKSGFANAAPENIRAAILEMLQSISPSRLACGVKEAIISEPGRFKGTDFAQQFAVHKARTRSSSGRGAQKVLQDELPVVQPLPPGQQCVMKAELIAKGCEHQRKLQVPPSPKHKPDILKGMCFESVVEVSDPDVRSNPDGEPEMSEIRPRPPCLAAWRPPHRAHDRTNAKIW